ncbi:hypothetical protein EG68_03612 [Paragonimus skrjabini miyazakii]|uniref:Uncharacterized protein n=1 Tax=Paragonimus skrjabini miyazakii TaxID=59628 RepID=A0A8S9Z1T0_9TREM|nr:hypothetical protein EG68_03612 [Paragonimus skrjabini miyazakii]
MFIVSTGKWINIGLLWREDIGLTLLVDGVQSTSCNEGGIVSNNEKLAQPYVALGRLNHGNRSTWLTPYMAEWEYTRTKGQNNPTWEMADFAMGEVAYFNRFLTPQEHKKIVGISGIAELRNFTGHIWFEADLVDSPIDQLTSAALANVSRPGPVYLSGKRPKIHLQSDPEVVQLQGGGGLRLIVTQQWRCKPTKIFCADGFSVGDWMRLAFPVDQACNKTTEYIVWFTGNEGKFGMAISQDRNLITGWYSAEVNGDNSSEWHCAFPSTELSTLIMNWQWIHYAIIWNPSNLLNESTLSLFVNGKLRNRCKQVDYLNKSDYSKPVRNAEETAKKLYQYTKTDAAHLLISSQLSDECNPTLSVAMFTFKPRGMASTFKEDERPPTCYVDADFLLKLHGMEVNHNGESNSSTAIRTIINGYSIDHIPCLSRPAQCKNGALTLSFWMRIDNFTDLNGGPVSLKPLKQYPRLSNDLYAPICDNLMVNVISLNVCPKAEAISSGDLYGLFAGKILLVRKTNAVSYHRMWEIIRQTCNIMFRMHVDL